MTPADRLAHWLTPSRIATLLLALTALVWWLTAEGGPLP